MKIDTDTSSPESQSDSRAIHLNAYTSGTMDAPRICCANSGHDGRKVLQPYQQAIAELIAPESTVLDIGCGKGALLAWLRDNKNVRGRGLEIESARVAEAVASGLSVVQGDADGELQYYPDKVFDTVVLSLTLQVMKHPRLVLEQALRIGRKAVVVIPNFGHARNRLYLLLKGQMPVTSALSYQWYETPNIHFCTIRDMTALAREIGCTVEAQRYLTEAGAARAFAGAGSLYANLFGEYGVFCLSRG